MIWIDHIQGDWRMSLSAGMTQWSWQLQKQARKAWQDGLTQKTENPMVEPDKAKSIFIESTQLQNRTHIQMSNNYNNKRFRSEAITIYFQLSCPIFWQSHDELHMETHVGTIADDASLWFFSLKTIKNRTMIWQLCAICSSCMAICKFYLYFPSSHTAVIV